VLGDNTCYKPKSIGYDRKYSYTRQKCSDALLNAAPSTLNYRLVRPYTYKASRQDDGDSKKKEERKDEIFTKQEA